jgi:hydroxymethylglutaryl-CoA reductase
MKLSELKEQIRSVIREQFIDEMSQNDIHFKAIMKFYDKGTSNAKKAISLYCCAKPNANRQQIVKELMDMSYEEIKDLESHFKLKVEYVDKKGVEHVAAALPQTEEEPIKECKTC